MRERRWLVLASTLLLALAGLAFALLRQPTYTASASVQLTQPNQDLTLIGTPAGQTLNPDKVVAAQAASLTNNAVVQRVRRRIGKKLTAAELRSSVQANVDPSSNLVTIAATADDAGLAARVANEFASQGRGVATREQQQRYVRAARELKARARRQPKTLTGLQARNLYNTTAARLLSLSTVIDPVQIVKKASTPKKPSSAQALPSALSGALLGLLLGIGLAYLLNALDRRYREDFEAEEGLGLPLAGRVYEGTLGRSGASAGASSKFEPADLENFRILRANLRHLDIDRTMQTVLVTSAASGEGKSTTAAGIAYAAGLAGQRTILVECDLRRPVFAERYGFETQPGLADYLTGDAEPEEVLRVLELESDDGADRAPAETDGASATGGPLPVTQIVCLPAGSRSVRPAEMLASRRFANLLATLRGAYDLIVLDTAPLLPVGDTLEIIPHADAVMLCVRLSQTTRDQARSAHEAVQRFANCPVGLVATGVRPSRRDTGYYSYGYSEYRADSVPAAEPAAISK